MILVIVDDSGDAAYVWAYAREQADTLGRGREGRMDELFVDRDEPTLVAVAAWLRLLAPAYGRGGRACLEQAARMVERHNVRMAEKRHVWRAPPERPAA